MSVTATVKKTTENVTGLIPVDLKSARKPLFAAVGVADLAIEQAKEVPADVTAEAKKVQARLTTTGTTVPAVVKTLPSQVKGLRAEVEARVSKVTGQATDVYAKLAVRGERLVTQIRRQPATEAAVAEGKEAVRKAEAAATAARKSVKAGEKAIEDAAAKIG